MGLAIDVELARPLPCSQCKRALVGWQSKWLECKGIFISEATPSAVAINEFISGTIHTICQHCRLWYEASIKRGKVTITKTEPLTTYQDMVDNSNGEEMKPMMVVNLIADEPFFDSLELTYAEARKQHLDLTMNEFIVKGMRHYLNRDVPAEIKELQEINHRLRTKLDLLRTLASSED